MSDAVEGEPPSPPDSRETLGQLVGDSPLMSSARRHVETAARNRLPVLITGESGTGKTLVAHLIHELSSAGRLVLVRPTRASEVGHFIAEDPRPNVRTRNTTILLDDVDRYPADAQARIQEELAEIEDLRRNDVKLATLGPRFLATSRGNVSKMVADGRFLPELYHRLNVMQVELPPLRDRSGDLTLLLHFFLRRFGDGTSHQLKDGVLAKLRAYGWPGNVREVESAVQRAIALAEPGAALKIEHLIPQSATAEPGVTLPGELVPLKRVMEAAEREHILRTLRMLGGNRGHASEALGISRKNLWEKLKSYGFGPDDPQK